MEVNEIKQTLYALLKQDENECLEFKEAKVNFDFDNLGKYFSALSNGANIANKQYAWLIFGVNDKTHELVNTNYRKNSDLSKLKQEITKGTNDLITFIDIIEVFVEDNKRVVMFKIPAAMGLPTTWRNFAYDRNGESVIPLNQMKIDQIKSTMNFDWSRQIIEEATIEDLDKDAILRARELFKKKNENRIIFEEIDKMNDVEFLNRVKLLVNNKITKTAMLLLGREESQHLFKDFNPQIVWKLQNDGEMKDYEIFNIPFIINIEKAKNKIRNLRYRYMINNITLFPNEVDQYDNYILREILNNSIAHQDYRKYGRITIIEETDKVIFINEGNFIPKSIDNLVINESYVPPYYRNPFLVNAMVSLDMIDTMTSGIKRIYNTQRKKYFPMPDYDFSEENRVKVVLYGKILDEQYTRILSENTDLDISIIILLDRVQKNMKITKEQVKELRKKNLVEGKYPNVYISKYLSEVVDKKAEYIENIGLDNIYYKELILTLIKKYKKVKRKDIEDLLLSKLPKILTQEQKKRKIKYLVKEVLEQKEGRIKNIGSNKEPIWVISDKNI